MKNPLSRKSYIAFDFYIIKAQLDHSLIYTEYKKYVKYRNTFSKLYLINHVITGEITDRRNKDHHDD